MSEVPLFGCIAGLDVGHPRGRACPEPLYASSGKRTNAPTTSPAIGPYSPTYTNVNGPVVGLVERAQDNPKSVALQVTPIAPNIRRASRC